MDVDVARHDLAAVRAGGLGRSRRVRPYGQIGETPARDAHCVDVAGFVAGRMALRTASGTREAPRVYRELVGGRADPAVGDHCVLEEDDDD
jgi:hypothetical protein